MAFPILGKICFPWVRGWEWKCIFLMAQDSWNYVCKDLFKIVLFSVVSRCHFKPKPSVLCDCSQFQGHSSALGCCSHPTAAVFPTPTLCNYVSYQVTVSSCDLLVVSVGQMSMSRAINLTQKLWTAGITAEIMYDWSQVRDRKLWMTCRWLCDQDRSAFHRHGHLRPPEAIGPNHNPTLI